MFGARRTVVLWAVLLTLFVVISTLLGGPSSTSSPAENASTWFDLRRSWAAPLSLFAIVFAPLYWYLSRINRLTVQGIALLEQGRHSQALEKLAAARARNPFSPLGPYNVGVVLSFLWRLAAAEEALAQAEKQAGRAPFIKLNAPPLRALVAALAGRTEDALALLARLDPQVRDNGIAQLARAVLACRGRAFAQAHTLADGLEVRRLGGSWGALGAALRAWAVAEGTGELRPVDRLVLFGETSHEAVRTVWPEFAAFVERAPAS